MHEAEYRENQALVLLTSDDCCVRSEALLPVIYQSFPQIGDDL